jgi:ubiquitin-protein ligase
MAATPNNIIKSFATKRLMAEWRDYTLTPSVIKRHINIQPLESNIFEWHGNLAPPEEHPYYSGCVFHFIFYFPEDYPKHPPSIELKTGFAHSNIIPNRYHEGRQYAYFLCMDVINNFFWQQDKGQNEYRGWSSAYSVETLLLQLYTFLFEERIENYDGEMKLTLYQKPPELGDGKYHHDEIRKNISNAWRECRNFKCDGCGHTYRNPTPVVVPSSYKELDDLNLRVPLGQLKLQIKPNTINWQEIPDAVTMSKSIITSLHSGNIAPSVIRKYAQLLNENIKSLITNMTADYLARLTHLPTTVDNPTVDFIQLPAEYPVLAAIYFNQNKLNRRHKENEPIVTVIPKTTLELTYQRTNYHVFGFCYPSSDLFLTTPDLVQKLAKYFILDGARFLNDFMVIYRNIFPNKSAYWFDLIGFKHITRDETELPFRITKCAYQPPEITDVKRTRAKELLQKLTDLLAQSILTPNRYILSKWGKAMDELWELLDIQPDINQEISRMIGICKQQRTTKNSSGCPYSCKTCWPNGAPKLDKDSEFDVPFTDPENLMTYCKSFLHPGVFHLSKIRRPESLENLRHLYKLWLTRYSDEILDQLKGWGYDYRGRQMRTIPDGLIPDGLIPDGLIPDGLIPDGITQYNYKPLELSETVLRAVLDALPTDSRLLLASASQQFARMLQTPEYRELTWLKCWTTGATPMEDVLGYPIIITTFKERGPESTCIKEISSTLDIISFTAYKDLEINKSVWNIKFGFFLPLYITPTHFTRARECLLKSVAAIYFNRRLADKPGKITQPPAVVINEIFSTLLNSLIVEMMRGETHISMKALEGFTQLYRTWYYLAEADPEIRRQATRVLTDFQNKTQSRHKRVTPNLGKLLMMICIAHVEFNWLTIRDAYIEESRDRNILWILRACPDIIQAKYWTDIIQDMPKVLDATLVGKRLQVFNKYFTELVKQPGFITELDITYGYPSEDLKQEFQQVMRRIYGMNSWDEYYRLTGQQRLSDSELARQIYWDTRTSTRKGYNIGIKGVSAVLGNDLELLKLFESNHSLEEITEFFKNFRALSQEQISINDPTTHQTH